MFVFDHQGLQTGNITLLGDVTVVIPQGLDIRWFLLPTVLMLWLIDEWDVCFSCSAGEEGGEEQGSQTMAGWVPMVTMGGVTKGVTEGGRIGMGLISLFVPARSGFSFRPGICKVVGSVLISIVFSACDLSPKGTNWSCDFSDKWISVLKLNEVQTKKPPTKRTRLKDFNLGGYSNLFQE